MNYYILQGTKHRKAKTDKEYYEWYRNADRKIDYTELPGGVGVSTVFLGLDHGVRSGTPVLYETMIFGGKHDEYQQRYYTYEEAQEGHKKAVELATSR